MCIRDRNGAVPKDTSKNGKPALVRTWRDLAVPEEAIRAESASAEASQASAPTQRKKQKRRETESDDESSEEEESDEEGEDESDDDEQSWTAKALIKPQAQGQRENAAIPRRLGARARPGRQRHSDLASHVGEA